MAYPFKFFTISVKALFKLRDDVAKATSEKATGLQRQLAKLTGDTACRDRRGKQRGRAQPKGRNVVAQFRRKNDPTVTWSGRGATPHWMKAEMKGTKLAKESFHIK